MTIPQDQNSQEWKDWRNSHIGASDIPCIIGKSKWATPFELWQRKLGFIEGIKDNYAMKRGRDMEPIVRDLFNKKFCVKFESEVLVHPDLEWASASLDGIDRKYQWMEGHPGEIILSTGAILEIKVPGLGDHQTAEQGEVPEHYFPQIQWQMFVSGIHVCYYVSYFNDEMAIVRIKMDEDYIAGILPTVAEFHRCIVEMEEPALSEDDFIQITDEEFGEAAREWKAAKEMADFYEDKEKFFKNKLITYTDDSNSKGYGITLKRIAREGKVDWKELWKDLCEHFPDAAAQYNPEHYRKEQIGYWKVTKDKKK